MNLLQKIDPKLKENGWGVAADSFGMIRIFVPGDTNYTPRTICTPSFSWIPRKDILIKSSGVLTRKNKKTPHSITLKIGVRMGVFYVSC